MIDLQSLLTDGITLMIKFDQRLSKINHEFEIRNALDKIEWLLEKKIISNTESDTLKDLINSKDHENFYFGLELINIKSINNDIRL